MSSKTNAIYIANLLVSRGLAGGGAEIGVFEGEFSKALLDHWALGAPLHLVDLWNGKAKGGMKANAGHMQKAINNVRRHENRVIFHAKSSKQAALAVPDNSLVLLYIDGDHSHPGCRTDLHTWWDKLMPGGLCAGHDFRHNCGVPNAVLEFAHRKGLPFTVVPEREAPTERNALWLMFKE